MDALRVLARHKSCSSDDLPSALATLTRIGAETLEVERVGVWLFDREHTRIVCAQLYDAGTGHQPVGTELLRANYPAYFAALSEERTIDAGDAFADPRTSEFASAYLEPNGIGAMLDAPIFANGHCAGVICCEHVGRPRPWSAEEQVFAGSLGDFAALALESHQRRVAETAARDREELLRQSLEAARLAIWSWDVGSGTLTWSAEMGPLFGYPPGHTLDYRGYLDHVHPNDRADLEHRIARSLEENVPLTAQYRIIWPDGSLHWVESRGRASRHDDGTPRAMTGTLLDITENKQLEDQLRQTQRLEAIGRLAGGIAHDFNNLLTIIRCAVRTLRRYARQSPEAAQSVDHVDHASRRSAELVAQLLAFARKQPQRREPVDVAGLIHSVGEMLRRVIGAPIALELDAPAEPLPVIADAGHLEQVVTNLVLNARDAMPAGGHLRISAAELIQDGKRYVTIDVEDTGCGIEREALPHIFDPFFTTKRVGEGTGMGLATSYGIINQLGGDILVHSTPGRGTRFRILLPEAPATWPAGDEAPEPEATAPRAARRRTVLLIEDDPLIQKVSSVFLAEAGYAVLSAGSGEEAVELAQAARQAIDIIVTDLVLPGLRGRDLLAALEALHPRAAVLCMSGYAEAALDDNLRVDREYFLPKPFELDDLLGRISSLLDARSQII